MSAPEDDDRPFRVEGLNRSRGRGLRLSPVVYEGLAARFRMLANEAICLVLQQDPNLVEAYDPTHPQRKCSTTLTR